MPIESDIKQNIPFKSPYQRLAVNLMYTANWLSDNQMRVLRPFCLTPQQYNVLRILRGQYPTPITVLAITERMVDKMSNASRLVDKLLAKELVKRSECPHDRRAVDVLITEVGLTLLTRIDELPELRGESLHNLTEAEANQVSALLDKLRGSEQIGNE